MQILNRKHAKVIILGKTPVVHLPAEWVRETGVQKGDSVTIYQLDDALVIAPQHSLTKGKVPRIIQKLSQL